MIRPFILKAIVAFALCGVVHSTHGQGKPFIAGTETPAPSAKPYKVLTNGKQVTLQLKQSLKSLIVWTASGHRIVEEKALQATTYTFTVPTKEKVFFMVLETLEGKRFTEKMGVK